MKRDLRNIRSARLIAAAELRAAIIAVLTVAGKPIAPRDIWLSPQVQKLNRKRGVFDTTLWTMHRSEQVKRTGPRGLYLLPTGSRAVAIQKPLNAPPVIAHNGTHRTATPTVRVDYDRQKQRLRFEVIGNLIIDIGAD